MHVDFPHRGEILYLGFLRKVSCDFSIPLSFDILLLLDEKSPLRESVPRYLVSGRTPYDEGEQGD